MGPLTRRIIEGPSADRRVTDVTPIIERRAERKPAWLRRMEDGQLPSKDLTARAA